MRFNEGMSGAPSNRTPHAHLSGLQPDALMAQGMRGESSQGVMVPGFELQALIGRGGMGAVFLARQIRLDREVAVKVLAGDLLGDALFVERIEREAHTMARLRHPNVVTVHDYLPLDDGGAAIVMEHVAGGNLREKMRRHPKGLPVGEAMALLCQIAAGLEAAHASGVIHRDMKPENVLLDASGMARVTDFGLALPLHESDMRLTLTGTTVGTVDYMAPEQLRGAELDVRLDIYALGVMAYEMLTGQTPRGSFDAPHRVRAKVPRQVSEAVMKALRPSPEDRFQSVEAFVAALHPSQGSGGAGAWTGKRVMGMVGGVFGVCVMGWVAWEYLPPLSGKNGEPLKQKATVLDSVQSAASNRNGATPEPESTSLTAIKIASAPSSSISDIPGEWRDALAGTNVHDDNFGGDWTYDRGILTSNDGICVMALEKELPDCYDVRMKFSRLSGRHSVALFFRAAGGVGSAELDCWDEGLAGVQMIDGETLQAGYGYRFSLENGRVFELLIEVRNETLRMSVDGEFQKEFNIQGKTLAPPNPWGWDSIAKPAALAVGSYQSPTRFEKVEWRPNKAPTSPVSAK